MPGLFGLIFGLIFGLFIWFRENAIKIALFEKTSWSPKKTKSFLKSNLIFWMIGGSLFGLAGRPFFGLAGRLIFILSGAFIYGLLGVLFYSLFKGVESEAIHHTFPNQGIRSSAKNAIKYSLIFGLIGGLIFGLIGGLHWCGLRRIWIWI